jgi:hypothetical protein
VGQLSVAVTRTSADARFLLGTHGFSTAGASVRFRRIADTDHDGRLGFDDVTAGARVRVSGRIIEPRRGCTAAMRVVARRILVRRR